MTLSFDYPWWIIALSAIGGIVVLALGWLVLYLIYHTLRGLVFTASYMRWSIRVMKLNGRKPAWNRFFYTLFKRWWYYIGYANNGSEIIRTGRSWWKGVGDYLIFDESKGQFVNTPPREPRFEGDDIEEDIDDDDDEFDEAENDEVAFLKKEDARTEKDNWYDDPDLVEHDDHIQAVTDEDEDAELAKLTAGGKRVTSTKDLRVHVKQPKRR
jgi:hypothetical protein